ncbi:hypothetical protein F4819DRAFT_236184 [Hypoxylon fuscum]|nr:hypothetical protein F4819DRAFT_236184 [Hypoxylon fuscum]
MEVSRISSLLGSSLLGSSRESYPVVLSSLDLLRLRWKPFGPLNTCIKVIDNVLDPSSIQRPYQMGSRTFHPVSTSAASQPPASSILVRQYDLEQWEDDWDEIHSSHTRSSHGADWAAATQHEDGVKEEEDAEGDSGKGGKLMHCCNEDRPQNPPSLVVRSSTQSFVTIHDFVTTVHPWLQSVKGDVLSAIGDFRGTPVPADTPLVVYCVIPNTFMLLEGSDGTTDFQSTWRDLAEHARQRVNKGIAL